MATLAINAPGRDIYLSTDHAASSYGVPVLVEAERAYGPADLIDSGLGPVTAAELVRQCGPCLGRPGDVDADEAQEMLDAWEAGVGPDQTIRQGVVAAPDDSHYERRSIAGQPVLISISPPVAASADSRGGLQWTWDVTVTPQSHIWYRGRGASLEDCRRQVEQRLARPPVSLASIDAGFDSRSHGTPVVIAASPDACDAVAHVRWDGGETVDHVGAVAEALRQAGYAVRVQR